MLVQTRDGWQIYGGNIASTLAGEFAFTIALAIGLFALGALGRTLDTGKRPWLPALLLALAAMSHVVVAIVMALFALLLFVTRRPWRTWPLAGAIGAVAVALTAVWSLPLIARHNMTQSMRYTKEVPRDLWELPGFVQAVLPGFMEHTIQGLVRGVVTASPIPGSTPVPASTAHQLWLPWWIWALGAVAVVAAGWYRRRSTFVLLVAALILAVAFVQWPEHAVWNTRFLPFYLLTCGFIAAMGATELVRLFALGCGRAVRWINEGDLHDARHARGSNSRVLSRVPPMGAALSRPAPSRLVPRRRTAGPNSTPARVPCCACARTPPRKRSTARTRPPLPPLPNVSRWSPPRTTR